MNHSQWKTRRTRKLLGEQVDESAAYVEAGHALALGQAVHDRRSELGLSQAEVARRAGMTQPQISTVEGGDSLPTLPLLTRLAKALDASLTIDLDGGASSFVFSPHGDRPGGRSAARTALRRWCPVVSACAGPR
ncbi:helix-turn-helix domain-containing protein [Kitasatospora sp. NBC_01560]|uniref:helix-turn-helix domain-containing protein n=1 Tax=Kitasatospora sp. NBC_01560 TaxID=2975965 RepID=UPI00386D06E6